MIPGDIDLTEKLDFRHDKDQSGLPYPIIPWKPETSDNMYISWSPTTWTSVTNYSVNWSNSTISINSPGVTNSYITSASSLTWSSLSNTISSQTYTITYNYDEDFQEYTFYFNEDNELINDYITEGVISSEIIDTKTKHKSFFGSKTKKNILQNISKNRCYKCGKYYFFGKECSCTKYSVPNYTLHNGIMYKIDKRLMRSRNFLDDNFERRLFSYENKIPWKSKNPQSQKRNKLARDKLAPWLEKLHNWIYDDYIHDLTHERDYTSYLTDMDWLRL